MSVRLRLCAKGCETRSWQKPCCFESAGRCRLTDVVEAIDAIRDHLTRGDLHDGLVYDAVRVRLIEIGEAVKGIDPALLGDVAGVPWKEIALMRDHLAHRYFDTDHAIVQDVVEHDLDPLAEAVQSLITRLSQDS